MQYGIQQGITFSDPRVAEFTTWYAHSDIEETKEYINYILSLNDKTSYNWIVEKDGKAVGTINVCYLRQIGIC